MQDNPNPSPENPQQKPAEKKDPRIPLTSSNAYAMADLPVEDLRPAIETQGPKDNPNVKQENNHNLVPVEPYVVQESVGLPVRTHMFFLPEQGVEFDNRMLGSVNKNNLETMQGVGWNASLMVANAIAAQQGMVQSSSVHRQDSEWRQYLQTEAGSYGFSSPRYAEDNAPLVDGTRARIRIRALMGNGGVITMPLVRSGFWITLYAPSESALYELNRRFNDDKITYGRMTAGMIFSNEQVYMNSWLLEFCMEHVYDATIKYANVDELRDLIDALDLPVLFAGMARLMYPRGFNYVRSIGTTEGIDKMQMIQGKLDIAKLLWIDNKFFTAKQKTHMSNRLRSTTTKQQLEEYKRDFVLIEGREVKFGDISLILATPSAEKYVNDGDRWVTGIVNMIDETFTTSRPTDEQRNKVIQDHANTAEMMRFSSFVKAVRFDGKDHTHPEVIEETLKTLSEDTEYVKKFNDALKKFISDSTAAMIAIPETSGVESEMINPRFPNLIPLDVVSVFFTLLAQKLQK